MELKECLVVLKKYKTTFIAIWIGVVAVGLLVAFFFPRNYRATFSIDITRDVQAEGVQEYDFDQFYRLEADDRFGRTVVQWLGDDAILKEIFAFEKKQEAGDGLEIQQFPTKFRAEKLANSYLKVSFLVADSQEIKPIFLGVKDVLKRKTKEFNGGFNKQNSFKLIFNGPTIIKPTIPLAPLLIGLFGGGFFLATFGIMIRKYLE